MIIISWLLVIILTHSTTSVRWVDRLEWTTSSGQILVNGEPCVLKGINYFGFETETYTPHGIWSYDLNYYLDFIKENSFNAIRVPFSLKMVKNNPINLNVNCGTNPGLCGKSALDLLDAFVDRAASRGLLIMLDNHRITPEESISKLWYNNEYSESQLISIWQKLVNRYRNRWNVFAIDLKNEPHDSASWGNSNPATDWNKAAERIIKSLSSFPGLFFVEGIEWGNGLENAARFPIDTRNSSLNNRVIYSPHCYGPSVYDSPKFNTQDFPHNLDTIYTAKYGYIVKEIGQPVVVGEWGGRAEVGSRDATWNNWYVEWLRSKFLTNNFYWCLNPNSRDTGGLLKDDWRTPIPRKIALTNRVQPNPTKFEARNGRIGITPGVFPESHCRVGGRSSGASVSNGGGTSSSTTVSSGRGGVTTTATVADQWQENGRTAKRYVLKIVNKSSSTVCSVDVKLNAVLKEKWNIEEISSDLYRTPSWMKIPPGETADRAGYVAYGDSAPTIKEVRKC